MHKTIKSFTGQITAFRVLTLSSFWRSFYWNNESGKGEKVFFLMSGRYFGEKCLRVESMFWNFPKISTIYCLLSPFRTNKMEVKHRSKPLRKIAQWKAHRSACKRRNVSAEAYRAYLALTFVERDKQWSEVATDDILWHIAQKSFFLKRHSTNYQIKISQRKKAHYCELYYTPVNLHAKEWPFFPPNICFGSRLHTITTRSPIVLKYIEWIGITDLLDDPFF